MKKKIIIDYDIPYIRNIFDEIADIQYVKGRSITSDTISDADALIIRTRTKCNKELLNGSKVSFIGTATIGVDHIDTEYCSAHGITVCNAPGCNANAVAQYVWNAIIHYYYAESGFSDKADSPHAHDVSSFLNELQHLRLGIIGYGHVGKAVADIARHLGIKFSAYDPPLADAGQNDNLCSLDEVLQCDIITVHTPLTTTGKYPTLHLLNENIFSEIEKNGRKPLVINAARGGIIDESTLLQHLHKGTISGCIIDCWENEPNISRELSDTAFISTPHIAGYSIQGKYNATRQIVDQLRNFFSITDCNIKSLDIEQKNIRTPEELTKQLITDNRIVEDSDRLKLSKKDFESQRNRYDYRNEIKLEF